jgi:predicted Rossmann fold flavoprotein
MNKYDVLIIGAGAAGLMAAGRAAQQGQKVLLLEKMAQSGRKLCITGKGRCNITSTTPLQEFIRLVKPDGRFLRSSFSCFFSEDLILFMNEIGVKTVIERGGRVFPENGKAPEVAKKLIDWCTNNGVTTLNNFQVNSLLIENNCIAGAIGINHKNNKELSYFAKKVIIATGGLSYPATGSTGDGYKFARKLGHTIIDTTPSLVPLESNKIITKQLNGLELKNINAFLWINDKKVSEDFGELTFYENALSGPVILTLSRLAVPALAKKEKVEISIDLKPALDNNKLDARLIRELNSNGKVIIENILGSLLPTKLISICLEQTNILKDKLGHQISSQERKALVNWLKNFKFMITKARPYKEAIITSGGISTKEINQKTMESKLISGLFFAGEVIDLDGPTGGYNLQIAFSTAWVAASIPYQKPI